MSRILHPVNNIQLKAALGGLVQGLHQDPPHLVPVCQCIGSYPVPVVTRHLVIGGIACHLKGLIEIETLIHQLGNHIGQVIIES